MRDITQLDPAKENRAVLHSVLLPPSAEDLLIQLSIAISKARAAAIGRHMNRLSQLTADQAHICRSLQGLFAANRPNDVDVASLRSVALEARQQNLVLSHVLRRLRLNMTAFATAVESSLTYRPAASWPGEWGR